MITEMFDTNFSFTLQMAAVLNFIHNKMSNYPLATHLNWAYLETRRHSPKSWSSFDFIENVSIYCFDFVQMASILDFTRNAITKVRPGHTPMSDMLGNPIVHTKVMILLPLKKNDINSRKVDTRPATLWLAHEACPTPSPTPHPTPS